MRRPSFVHSLALVVVLSLGGCSTDAAEEQAPTAASTAASSASDESSTTPTATATSTATAATATFELDQSFTVTTSYGAVITVEVPSIGPGEVEQLRTDLKIAPVSYAKVGIDNRQGTEDVSVYRVTLYDEDGVAYEFQDLSVYHVSDWGPVYTDALGGVDGQYGYTLIDGTVLDEDLGDDLSRRSTELHNLFLTGTDASKLEVSSGWLASTTDELPERITGITVQAYGLSEEVAMAPGGTMPSVPSSPAPTATEPPESTGPSLPPTVPSAAPDADATDMFTYDEALEALNGGMPYYEAFCLRYEPTTDAGRSQCEGIEAGTVDSVTGEYIGG